MAESEYEQQRRAKRDAMRAAGIDPYGTFTTGIRALAEIKPLYQTEMGHDAGPVVKAAGRIVFSRDMGKLAFIRLRDETGELQVALDARRLDEPGKTLRPLLDLGDQIVVEGPLGTTKTGEVTIWATTISMAAKALLPPPAKWEGLTDVEARYRQRYVDFWANPDSMRLMKLRFRIVQEIRDYLRGKGFIEVETPMMQPLHGGAAARPFKTHHEALDLPLFMRIAPELYLKRLLVGGFTKVFELNRNFRNEGISPRHNPEFTMLEAYEAFGSWETMANLVEDMICTVAMNVFGTLQIQHEGRDGAKKTIDLTRPWRRATMADLVREYEGWQFDKRPILQSCPALYERMVQKDKEAFERVLAPQAASSGDSVIVSNALVRKMSSHYESWLQTASPFEQLVEVYEKYVEPKLVNPCFVTQVPSVIIPLAKKCLHDTDFADVYELAINGQEISPGYSELNDPDVQAANFMQQVGDEAEKQQVDHDFLNALKYGMPPAGGMGLGIDRLVMMLTGAESIRDIIAFPLMRPVAEDAH